MGDVIFEQLPTGRTHQVNGVYEAILGEDGKPETEWVLSGVVDGHRVPLQSFSVGYVEHQVGRDDTAIEQPAPAAPAAAAPDSSAELDAANARIADLEAQLAQAQAAPPAPPAPPAAQ